MAYGGDIRSARVRLSAPSEFVTEGDKRIWLDNRTSFVFVSYDHSNITSYQGS